MQVKAIPALTEKITVVLESVSEKFSSKLKPEDLALYQKDLAEYNEFIKSVTTKYPISGNAVEYKYRNQLLPDDPAHEKALYLSCTKFTYNYADPHTYHRTIKVFEKGPEDYNKKDLTLRSCRMELHSGFGKNQKVLFFAQLPDVMPDMADLTYAIKNIAHQVKKKKEGYSELQLMRMYISEAPKLKSITLYLNEAELDGLTEKDVKEVYKYAIKLVDAEAIRACILKPCEQVALGISVINADGSSSYKLFEPVEGAILGQSGTPTPNFDQDDPTLHNKIRVKNLEEFGNYIE